jgi:soluble lytic murein transglycosylase
MHHDPNALAWYARAGDMSDLQLAWKARAALRARAWDVVLAAVEAMTEKGRSEPAWRYWEARALKELGRAEEAEQILKPLATEFNFYGQLALEELGGKIATPPAVYKPGTEDVGAVNQLIGIRRALELYRLGLRPEANREWVWAIRDFDDKQLLAAAEVARRYEVYDRAINTADRTAQRHNYRVRFLAPYREVFSEHARTFDLEEAWVLGLVRQESRFIASAKSSAGAQGLMQLMPSTARWVARRIGLKDYRASRVAEVGTNIALGTGYLKLVLDDLGHPVLALAAYNAGPGAVGAWQALRVRTRAGVGKERGVGMRPAPDELCEEIPADETKVYVKQVLARARAYTILYTPPTRPGAEPPAAHKSLAAH